MSEKIDPFFRHRLEQGKAHRVLESVDLSLKSKEAEENRELPNPKIEGSLEDFGWREKSVDNFIDALANGFIDVSWVDEKAETISVEFLPIESLPEQLGHVTELEAVQENMRKENGLFGPEVPDRFTYLQTVDFAVEGYMADEENGKKYARIYVNSKKLQEKRNVYLDPESLNATDYEYGYGFAVKGGVPVSALDRIDIIKARKIEIKPERADSDDERITPDNIDAYIKKQVERLKKHIRNHTKDLKTRPAKK